MTRIRQLAESEGTTAFEMGDEALDQCPMGQDGAHNDSSAKLTELAEASNVLVTTLADRRFVSSRVPPTLRNVAVPWQVYANVARMGDATKRQRLLQALLDFDFSAPPTVIVDGIARKPKHGNWTIDAIMSHLGEPPPNALSGSNAQLQRAFKGATPETIVNEVFKTAAPETILNQVFKAATPEAMDTVLQQPDARRAVAESLHRAEQRAEEKRERFITADPIAKRIDQAEAMVEVQKWVDVMRRHIDHLQADILPRLGQAPDRERDPMALRLFLSDALADLDTATAPIRHFVETGSSDLDAFLSRIGVGKNG